MPRPPEGPALVARKPRIEMTVEEVQLAGGTGMVYEKDVPVEMSDGVCLRVNVFRPAQDARYRRGLRHGSL
jgi:predicted acyl esterase